jgi:hypothetical protein
MFQTFVSLKFVLEAEALCSVVKIREKSYMDLTGTVELVKNMRSTYFQIVEKF